MEEIATKINIGEGLGWEDGGEGVEPSCDDAWSVVVEGEGEDE